MAPTSSEAVADTIHRYRVTSSRRPLTAVDLASLAADIQTVLETAGVVDPTATATADGLEVRMPAGMGDPGGTLQSLLDGSGSMRILDPGTTIPEDGSAVDPAWPVLMDGSRVDGTTVHLVRDDNGLQVQFGLRPEAVREFAAWTSEHVGRAMAVALDDRVLTAPVIMGPMGDGRIAVSTARPADVLRLAAVLRTAGGVTLLPLGS